MPKASGQLGLESRGPGAPLMYLQQGILEGKLGGNKTDSKEIV